MILKCSFSQNIYIIISTSTWLDTPVLITHIMVVIKGLLHVVTAQNFISRNDHGESLSCTHLINLFIFSIGKLQNL